MKGDKKKGDSEESPNEKERVDEFVNEWCRLYRETSQACAILWVGIPLLICGLIVYTELEEHCPELMGDMTDRNTEEFDKEENK